MRLGPRLEPQNVLQIQDLRALVILAGAGQMRKTNLSFQEVLTNRKEWAEAGVWAGVSHLCPSIGSDGHHPLPLSTLLSTSYLSVACPFFVLRSSRSRLSEVWKLEGPGEERIGYTQGEMILPKGH